jgi:AcrR family transcriptional regulator
MYRTQLDARMPLVRADDPKPTRLSQAERNAATRAALVDAAYGLFGERGYQAVATGEVVAAAGVTRGALYHHFKDKSDLFCAVFERVEVDSVAAVQRAIAGLDDPWQAALVGARAYLDFCRDSAVQRVIFVDGPAILPEEQRREIVDRHGGALIHAMIGLLIAGGVIDDQPVEPLAAILTGLLIAGAEYIGRSDDPGRASGEIAALLERLLGGLASGGQGAVRR